MDRSLVKEVDCSRCENRGDCRSLCSAAARYADQDLGNYDDGGRLEFVDPGPLYECEGYEYDPQFARLKLAGVQFCELESSIQLGDDEWSLVCSSGLSELQQQYLYLYFWEHLSTKTIAELFNVRRQTIERTIDRAKKRIRNQLFRPQLQLFEGFNSDRTAYLAGLAAGERRRQVRRTL